MKLYTNINVNSNYIYNNNYNYITRLVITILFLIMSVFVLTSCTDSNRQQDSSYNSQRLSDYASDNNQNTQEIFAMDTYMTLTAYGDNAESAVDEAIEEIKRLDAMFSVGNADSDVTKLNANGSGVVSDETAYIINKAMQVSKETKGAFDITIYPLMELWGFTTKNYRVPDAGKIADVLKTVSYTNVAMDGSKVELYGNASIDLGGIAKGYTSSRVIDIFKNNGIEHAMINLGGNVQVLGSKLDGSLWRVAVQNPDNNNSYLGVLSVEDKAVITSGGYERYFKQDGQVYHHIIDPSTGYPSESELTSVTIVCSDGTTADALSTALFVMGLDDAGKLYKESSIDFDMILFDGGTVYVSEGIADDFSTDKQKVIITK